jgi:hypothetical protein
MIERIEQLEKYKEELAYSMIEANEQQLKELNLEMYDVEQRIEELQNIKGDNDEESTI